MSDIFDSKVELAGPDKAKEKDKFERVFVALSVPQPSAGALTTLFSDIPNFRWNEEMNLHLTLRFIGEVDEALREAISAKLETIAVEPFILPIEKVGVFPTKGQPQVVYAGIGTGHTRLYQLQHRVEEALAGLGLPLILRTFSPHITLARVSKCSPNVVQEFVKKNREFSAPPFKVDKFCLYRSRMTHFGSEYTLLKEYHLRSKQAKVG